METAASELVQENSRQFSVHTRVYTDSRVFELEMRRIFGATWVYVGHESEIPRPGRYKTAYIGLQPVIVSRDASGQVHVLLNRCRHRGAAVCRESSGEARSFICPYHGWSYDLDGTLQAITQRDGYPQDFPQKDLGLAKVPRMQIYRGLIFASLNAQVHSLEEHLGSAKEIIDTVFDVAPEGRIDLSGGHTKHAFSGNWKFQCENTVDGYHGNYVHRSFQQTSARSKDTTILQQTQGSGVSLAAQKAFRELGQTLGLRYGHGALQRPLTAARFEELLKDPNLGSLHEQAEARLGRDRALEVLAQHNLFIFPNLFLAFGPHLRVVQPVRVDHTEVYQYHFRFEGLSQESHADRLRRVEQFQGPGGFGTPDDLEAFHACQEGLKASAVEWLVFSRGVHREAVVDANVRTGHSSDETPQRAMYREWRRLMASEHLGSGD
jgi:benzoate/toluate 1,2-dioxygenase subunit alpha